MAWIDDFFAGTTIGWPPTALSTTDTLTAGITDASSAPTKVQTNRLAPDAILTETNLTGAVSLIQDDPDIPVNLLTAEDASFEGGTIGSWATLNGDTFANSTADALDGTHSLLVTVNAGIAMSIKHNTMAAVVAGNTYSFLASFKLINGGSDSISMQISWYNAASSFLSNTFPAPTLTPSASWQQLAATGLVAPASAAFAQLILNGSNVGRQYYLDKVGVMQGNTTTWALPGGTDSTWINGTSGTAAELRVSFPSPANTLVAGFTQEFRVRVRPRP